MTLFSGPNVQVTFDSDPHNDRSESSLAANPTDPANLVGASKKFTDPATYQFSLAAVYSTDGGQSWSPGDDLQPVPDILGETISGTSDPVVVFDDQGQAYLLGLAFHYNGANQLADLMGMVIYTSGGPPAGQHWSQPTIIHQAPTKDDDKGAMASDLSQSVHTGNVYVTWDGTDANGNGGVLFARTTDHGLSWKGVSTNPTGSLILPNAHYSAVTVDSNGALYVFALDGSSADIVYVTSTDGGQSFSSVQTAAAGITSLQNAGLTGASGFPHLPGGVFRVETFPTVCAAQAGGLVVAWADYRDGVARIYCRHSPDGNAWDGPPGGQPLLTGGVVSDVSLHDFHPQLALAPDGSIGCAFYEFGPTPSANLINTVLARSTDNGRTFTERVTVTDKPWDPTVDAVTDEFGDTFIGDYFGLAADSLGFFPFWTDTRTGIQELFTAQVNEIDAEVTPPSKIVSAQQTDSNQLDALFVGLDGAVNVMWVAGEGTWQGPAPLTGPVAAPPGAHIALAHQVSDNQLDALFVALDGAVTVMWVVGEGTWQGPAPLTGPAVAPPGAPVPLAHQVSDNQLDALFVGLDGAVNVMWVVDAGTWNGPVPLTSPGAAPPGAPVALAHQVDNNQLDALFVGPDGAVNVMWVVGTGTWNGPVPLTGPGAAPPGAPVALAHQVDNNQLDALFVGPDGAVNVMWVVDAGTWNGPVPLTPPGAAPPGAPVALAHQVDNNQLDALFVGPDGAVNVMWVVGAGTWNGPVPLTGPGAAPVAYPVGLGHQVTGNQLDAVFAGPNGAVNIMWVVGAGTWQGPDPLTGPGAIIP